MLLCLVLLFGGVAATGGLFGQVVENALETTGEVLTGHNVSKIRFILYTTTSNSSYPITTATELPADPLFDATLPTVFYAHGWTESTESESVGVMSRAFLQRRSHNFVLIDWSQYVPNFYLISSLRVPAVAEAVGATLNRMVRAGVNKHTLWLIGHSLGGQLVGAVVKYLDFKPTRITGLDPAGPLYTGLPLTPGLTRDDADMVDVIHTDAGVAGYAGNDGTIDFWPNGGKRAQPGCHVSEAGLVNALLSCSHHMSWQYFAASVVDETAFPAVSCGSWKAFKDGSCPPREGNVAFMGFAFPSKNMTGTFYLRTSHQKPYGLGMNGVRPTTEAQERRNAESTTTASSTKQITTTDESTTNESTTDESAGTAIDESTTTGTTINESTTTGTTIEESSTAKTSTTRKALNKIVKKIKDLFG